MADSGMIVIVADSGMIVIVIVKTICNAHKVNGQTSMMLTAGETAADLRYC